MLVWPMSFAPTTTVNSHFSHSHYEMLITCVTIKMSITMEYILFTQFLIISLYIYIYIYIFKEKK